MANSSSWVRIHSACKIRLPWEWCLPSLRPGFTNASLNGASVIEASGLAPNGGTPVPDVLAGLLNADGSGTVTASFDENQGGTMTQQSQQGTYSVATNGKVTFTGLGANPPILYLSGANQAFLLGTDSSVSSGIVEPQIATPPYNNASILGTYLGGTTAPVQSSLVDSVSFLFADGNGNINGIEDFSGPTGPGTQNLFATYQVSSTGRTTLSGTPAGVAYVVSNKKIVVLPSGTSPVLATYSTAATN